mmetsp:Transcript_1941/g.4469  ORF Transcript_1941/g.4469 Transcript_1941/m.4469 type:complete len:297 (-) Transcript_1941:160-1050(-)
MGAVDRTEEFEKILEGMGVNVAVGKASSSSDRMPNQIYLASSEIGRDIQTMQNQIDELRKVARKKNIFDDKSSKSDQLIVQIKQMCEQTEQKIQRLDQQASSSGSLRSGGKQAGEAAKNAVEALKLRHKDITLDFYRVCEERNRAAMAMQKQRDLYGTRPQAKAIRGADYFDSGGGSSSSGGTEMTAMGGENVGLMRGGKQIDPGYADSRAEAMQTVQRAIADVGQMFKRMRDLINEQEYAVMRIDQDVTDTQDNLDQAEKSLLQYLDSISSNRMLIIKVFAIIIGFIVFFIVFLS